MSSDIPQGYLPPDDAYVRATEFTLANDPLVNDVYIGVGGWFSKIGGILTRSWRMLLPIFIITRFVPTAIILSVTGGGTLALADEITRLANPGQPPEVLPDSRLVGGGLGAFVIIALFGLLVQTIGYAAATYTATRQAAGYTVRLGEAMRYGLRRCGGLTGWWVASALVVGLAVGLLAACLVSALSFIGLLIVLPVAVYAIFTIAMVGPAYLFERRNALKRSFQLFHEAPARNAGRLLLVGLVYVVVAAVQQATGLLSGLELAEGLTIAVVAVTILIRAAIDVPFGMLIFAGILATYAENQPSLTPDLVRQL
jgi:hypothetical protein